MLSALLGYYIKKKHGLRLTSASSSWISESFLWTEGALADVPAQ